jgi:hypothetical protein
MKWLLFFTAVMVGLVLLGAVTTIEVPWQLVTGWVPYLARVLPRMTIDLRTTAVGVAAFVLFLAGLHGLGRAINRRWRLRWSLAAVAGVVVMFAAGICLIGAVHQTGWLLSGDEPAIVEVDRLRGGETSNEANLKYIAWGVTNEFDANGGRPPDRGVSPASEPLHSWITLALPYTAGGYQTQVIDMTRPWNDPVNRRHFTGVLIVFINPTLNAAPVRDADGYGLSHYAANSRAMVNGNFRPIKELSNGTSNTLLIGEINANFEPWGKPGNCRDPLRGIGTSAYGFGGPAGSGGVLFGMADGSVRFVSDRVSPAVLNALATGGPIEE